MLRAFALLLMLPSAALAADHATNTVSDPAAAARQRWADSPYGPMLERILPPGIDPTMLPHPQSRGAQLEVKYCVQCHNLPNPAMHHAQKWPSIYERMVARMEGRGNMGKLMAEMMAGVSAPSAEESRVLIAYLQQNAQKPLDPVALPQVNTPAAEAFRLACQQCHVLPDPRRHTAREWPAVVARMQANMEWMNRVVGSKPGKDEPQLRVEDINAFLARHARSTR
jgi:hypothetical protein